MPPFESSSSDFTPSQYRTWSKQVEPQMRKHLGGNYWRRYNILEITYQNEDDYYNTAMEVAKLSEGREADFERIFEERIKKRREKLFQLLKKGAHQTLFDKKKFPCERSRQTVAKVCESGCVQDFLALLNGTAHGWEANATDVQLDNPSTSNLSEETDKIQEPLELSGKIQTDTSYNDQLATQLPPEECYTMEKPSAYATYPIGILVSEKGNNDNKAPIIPRKRKRDQFNSNVFDACGNRRESESTTSSSLHYTSIHESATDETSTLHDDGDDNHVYKRRKLGSSSASEPTVINPPPQLPDKGTVKKRSRYDDCDDDCDDGHGHKRQKLDIPTTCTPSQPSLSVQRLGEKVTVGKSRRRHKDTHGSSGRKRKQSPPNTSRSLISDLPTNRALRSTRGVMQSDFWELDTSGKARSI